MVGAGVGGTRSEVVRHAVALLADTERRRRIGEQIAQSYRDLPERNEFDAMARASLTALVEEAPWELKADGLWGPCE